ATDEGSGRVRERERPGDEDSQPGAAEAGTPAGAGLGDRLGERATLVQFSSAFCAPCRATRRVLDEVAGMVPGVTHVEIDAEANLPLVRRLEITRAPTVLVPNDARPEGDRAASAA